MRRAIGREHGEDMQPGSTVTIRGAVSKIYFSSADFSTGQIQDSETGRFVKFAGACLPKVDDRVVISGKVMLHPKFGLQVAVTSCEFDMEMDANGLRLWLEKSEAAKGIGPKRALAIAEYCGARFEEIIGDEGQRRKIGAVCKIPADVLDGLAKEWEDRRQINRALVELAKWGISPGKAKRLVDSFGVAVVGIVKSDPYWLIGRVDRFGFLTVDKIAMGAGVPRTHPSRITSCIVYLLENEADRNGCTWMGRGSIVADASKMLALEGMADGGCSVVDGAIGEMIESKMVVREFGTAKVAGQAADEAIFLPSLYEADAYVCERLQAAGESDGIIGGIAIEDVRMLNPDLNDDQAEAVLAAFKFRASVISGGAGVGKTYTIDTIVQGAEARGLTVSLCAPTGKAAQRLGEMTGRSATTIHRLLEVDRVNEGKRDGLGFRFRRNRFCPIESDLVVVDEVSMVDVRLMRSLLDAIDFRQTSLVLVGDHNQLPSVGPGAILRDAIVRRFVPVKVLEKVVRQAGELKRNVSAVLDGVVARTSVEAGPAATAAMRIEANKRTGPPSGAEYPGSFLDDEGEQVKIAPWYVFGKETPDAVREFLADLFTTRLARYSIERNGRLERIDPANDVQLLTPMHKGPIGTRALNAMMQRIFQKRAGVDVPPHNGEDEPKPLVGDRVLYLRNDPELGVMNGNTGNVLARDHKTGAMTVMFDGLVEPVEIDAERRDNVVLAYAMTVHKSQGSEFPVVVYVCARAHTVMHHRGLFYTAVSRSRQSAIVVGDGWAIANCARTTSIDGRRTLANLRCAAYPPALPPPDQTAR